MANGLFDSLSQADQLKLGAGIAQSIPGLVSTFRGTPMEVGGTTQRVFRPEDAAALQEALAGVRSGQQTLVSQLDQARAALPGTLALQQFTPQFSTQPDVIAQGFIGQGQQALRQQAGAQQRSIQRQLGATSPGLAQALSRRAGLEAGLQANPLLLQALQEQQQRQLAQQQLGLQSLGQFQQAQLAQRGQQLQEAGLRGQLAQAQLSPQLALAQLQAQLAEAQAQQVQQRDIQNRGGLGLAGLLGGVLGGLGGLYLGGPAGASIGFGLGSSLGGSLQG